MPPCSEDQGYRGRSSCRQGDAASVPANGCLGDGKLSRYRRRTQPLPSSRPRLIRCTPLPKVCARFDDSVRELTPIQEISEDSRPYSIFGQRFITTLIPASSAS